MSQQESENVEQPSTKKGTTSASDAASPRSTKNPAQRRLAKQTAHPATAAGQARATATASEDKDISDYASALADFAASPLFAKIMGSEKDGSEKTGSEKTAGKTPESAEDKNHHTVAKTAAEAPTAQSPNEATLRQPTGKALPVTSSVIANTAETSGSEAAMETIVSDQPTAQSPEAENTAEVETAEVEIEEFARIGAEATPYPYRRYTQEEPPAPTEQPANRDDDPTHAQGIVLVDEQEVLQVHQAEALAEKFSAKTIDEAPQTTIIAEPEAATADDAADVAAGSTTASNAAAPAEHDTAQPDNFDQAEALTIQFAAQPADFSTTTDANFVVETTALTGAMTEPATTDDREAEYIAEDLDRESTALADEAAEEPVAEAEPARAKGPAKGRPSPDSADSNVQTGDGQVGEPTTTADASFAADAEPETAASSVLPSSVAAAGAVAAGGSMAAAVGAAAAAVTQSDGSESSNTEDTNAEAASSMATADTAAQPQPAEAAPVETAQAAKPSTPDVSAEQTETAAPLAEGEDITATAATDQRQDPQQQEAEPEVEVVHNASSLAAQQQVKGTGVAGTSAGSASSDGKETAEETAVSDSTATEAQAAAAGVTATTGTQAAAQPEPAETAPVEDAPSAKSSTPDASVEQSETAPHQAETHPEVTATATATQQDTSETDPTASTLAVEESAAQRTENADLSAASIEPTSTKASQAVAATEAQTATSSTAIVTPQSETLDASSPDVAADAKKTLDIDTTASEATAEATAAQPESADTSAVEPSGTDPVTDAPETAELQPTEAEYAEVADTSAPVSPDTVLEAATTADSTAEDFSQQDQQAESVEPVASSGFSSRTKFAGGAAVTGAAAAGAAFLQRFKEQQQSAEDTNKQGIPSDEASAPPASAADDSALEIPVEAQQVESESVEETVVTPTVEDASSEALYTEETPVAPTAESDTAQQDLAPEQVEHFTQEEAQTVQFVAQPAGYATPDAMQADELDLPAAATDAPVEQTTEHVADTDFEQQADQPSLETNTAHINFSDAATGATWVAERPNRETPENVQPDFGDFATGIAGTNAPYSLRSYGDDSIQPASQLPDDTVFIPQQPAEAPEEYHDEDFAAPPQVASPSLEAEKASNDARTLRADSMLPLAGETVQLDREPETINPQVTEYSSGPGKKPIRAAAILLADDSTDTSSSTATPVKKSRNKRLFIVLTFLVLLFVAVACVAGYLFTRNSATSQPTDGSLAAPKSGIALEGAETPAESIPPSAMRLQAEDAHAEPLGIAGATLKIETSDSLRQALAYIEGQPQTEAQLQVWTRDENQDYVFRGPIVPDQTIDLTPENTLLAIVAADVPFEEGALPPLFPGGEILVETIIWP